jgi:hypothetical protein
VYVLKELCRPDSGIHQYPAEFLRCFVVPELGGERRKIVVSYLSPDSWNNWGDGHTIAGQFQELVEEYGITLTKASTDREGGWQRIYGMLKSGELVICGDTCPQLVKAIPTRIHDPKKPGDILKRPGDHADDAMDALRDAARALRILAIREYQRGDRIMICEQNQNMLALDSCGGC